MYTYKLVVEISGEIVVRLELGREICGYEWKVQVRGRGDYTEPEFPVGIIIQTLDNTTKTTY